jgi:predicted nucleic-acid-binding protein
MIEKITLIDTNVILRYLLKDNIDFYDTVVIFFENLKIGTEKAIILESVLTECVYVLIKFYKIPKDETIRQLYELLCYKGIVNKDKKELKDALIFFSEKNIAIVDCILWAKAKNNNMELLTFDKILQKCKQSSKVAAKEKGANHE